MALIQTSTSGAQKAYIVSYPSRDLFPDAGTEAILYYAENSRKYYKWDHILADYVRVDGDGTTPSLQDVTNIGSSTNKDLSIENDNGDRVLRFQKGDSVSSGGSMTFFNPFTNEQTIINGGGVILTSPAGLQFILKVADDGTLSTVAV